MNSNKITCQCGCVVSRNYYNKHLKTKKCIQFFKREKEEKENELTNNIDSLIVELKSIFDNDKRYVVEKYGMYALIHSDFVCAVESNSKWGGWTQCYKCECKYGCNVSDRLTQLAKKYNRRIEWKDCVSAIL